MVTMMVMVTVMFFFSFFFFFNLRFLNFLLLFGRNYDWLFDMLYFWLISEIS